MSSPEQRQSFRQRRKDEWISENGPCNNCGTWENLSVYRYTWEPKQFTPIAALWSMAKDNPNRIEELALCHVLCKPCWPKVKPKRKPWRCEYCIKKKQRCEHRTPSYR